MKTRRSLSLEGSAHVADRGSDLSSSTSSPKGEGLFPKTFSKLSNFWG